MKIQLFHTKTCHAYRQAIDELKEALKEVGAKQAFDVILVDTEEGAERLHFFASPTIHFDGEDIDPEARKITRFGINACRPYFWQGKSYDYPPKEMLVEVLRKAQENPK